MIESKFNNSRIACDAFPRKRGYEVICVLEKKGQDAIFASHGTRPTYESAMQKAGSVIESMKDRSLYKETGKMIKKAGYNPKRKKSKYYYPEPMNSHAPGQLLTTTKYNLGTVVAGRNNPKAPIYFEKGYRPAQPPAKSRTLEKAATGLSIGSLVVLAGFIGLIVWTSRRT